MLGFIVADHLVRSLPAADEGLLSRTRAQIVRRESLAHAAQVLNLQELLAVGGSETRQSAALRDSLLSDAYEALIGAMYIDNGFSAAVDFVHATLATAMRRAIESPTAPDPKTKLQMLLQGKGRPLPEYRIVGASGVGHNQRFVAEVWIEGIPYGRGEGSSKRAATTEAAIRTLHTLEGQTESSDREGVAGARRKPAG